MAALLERVGWPSVAHPARAAHPGAVGLLAALLTLFLAPWALAAPEAPLPAAARAHYEAGLTRYAAKDFVNAARELGAAYALEPRREILFAQAQATRLGGDCAAATLLFQRFLDTGPPPRQVEATRIALARCRETGAAGPADTSGAADEDAPAPALTAAAPAQLPASVPAVASAAVPAPGIASPPPAAPAAAVAAAPSPALPAPAWYRDRAGGLLALGAASALVAGTGLILSARAVADDAALESTYDAYEGARARAQVRRGWGAGALAAGGLLAVAAAGRYAWVALHPQPAGGALVVGGRF